MKARHGQPQSGADGAADLFAVDAPTILLVRLASALRRQWAFLGDRETRSLQHVLEPIAVDRPVWVTGLARSGSTVLLEYLAAHEGAATHRYRDFPMLFTPVWWATFYDSAHRGRSAPTPVERSHRDGITVTPESPEALEEILWMTFFRGLHQPGRSLVLDERTSCPAFEAFYGDHLRKMLWLRGGTRFVSKDNYHVPRLRYLRRLFPDCRMVIPVREPSAHVASMMKQQRLFCASQTCHPRSREYLAYLGHFEFGLDRRPMDLGGPVAAAGITALWERAENARAWARYWAMVYGYLDRILAEDPDLAQACTIVRFEEMCEHPADTLARVSGHCGLKVTDEAAHAFAARMHYPTYYRPEFSDAELAAIHEETRSTAERYGYR